MAIHPAFSEAYDELAAARAHYEDVTVNRSPEELPAITAARVALNNARRRVEVLRKAYHPTKADLRYNSLNSTCFITNDVLRIQTTMIARHGDDMISYECPSCSRLVAMQPGQKRDDHSLSALGAVERPIVD